MYTTYEFKFTLSKNTINTAAPTTIHSFIHSDDDDDNICSVLEIGIPLD